MATLITKNSSTASAAPLAADLTQGELAVNVTDKKLYSKDSGGAVVKLVGGLGNQEANAVAITGGTINGATVGATTAAAGAFTTLSASSTLGVTGVSTLTGGAVVEGMTVGKGAGAVATNTAVGASALAANTTGLGNTSVGYQALDVSTSSDYHTAVGWNALGANTTGARNTAFGAAALATNSTGGFNVAMGVNAGYAVTTGSYNVALGYDSLSSNTTASNNTAVGYQAGYTNTGSYSTFIGYQAGYSQTTGNSNTCVGQATGYGLTTGTNNTFISAPAASGSAGYYVTTGSKNTILGVYNGNQGGLDIRTASNYIVLSDGDGNPRARWDNNGRPFFPDLGSDAGTNAVKFNTGTGRLSYDTSSARYKDNIRDSVYGLSHVMQMRSAQFEYKEGGRSDVGLIAEELQPIVPELVGVNKEGQADSVSYDRMVSVLVKAIQELKAEFDSYKLTHP